jgi:hypothetical protein
MMGSSTTSTVLSDEVLLRRADLVKTTEIELATRIATHENAARLLTYRETHIVRTEQLQSEKQKDLVIKENNLNARETSLIRREQDYIAKQNSLARQVNILKEDRDRFIQEKSDSEKAFLLRESISEKRLEKQRLELLVCEGINQQPKERI